MDFLRPLIVAIAFGVGFYFAGQTVYWLFRYLTLGMTDKRTRLDDLKPRLVGFAQLVGGHQRRAYQRAAGAVKSRTATGAANAARNIAESTAVWP